MRVWHSLGVLSLVGIVQAATSQNCTYKCNVCPPNDFYNIVNGVCTNRTENTTVTDARFGSFLCAFDDAIIHDEASCLAASSNKSKFFNLIEAVSDIDVEWFNKSGCFVVTEAPQFFGGGSLYSRVCFRKLRWQLILGSVLGGAAAGFIIAIISTVCSRNSLKDAFDEEVAHREDFWPGARRAAAATYVPCSRRLLALLYRTTQVIANLWLPPVMLLFFHEVIVVPLWLVLYLVPGLWDAGRALFYQPIYLATPPDVSLWGIDHSKQHFVGAFAFSAIRPGIFAGLVMFVGRVVSFADPDEDDFYQFVFNPVAYFRMGLMSGSGPLVLDFVLIVTTIGCILHSFMTMCLVFQKICVGEPNNTISLVWDEELCEDCTELTKRICDAAIDIDDDDEEEYAATGKNKISDVGAVPFSRWSVFFALVLLVVDFAAYVYKIIIFLVGARYIPAAIITCSLSEALWVLALNGSLCRAPAAWRRAARDGVATADFLACCQWDDGIAGVPYMMTTIYALPISGISSWLATLSSIFFICTGTRAMAAFMQDTVDADMYDAKQSMTKRLDRYLIGSSRFSSRSEDEDMSLKG